jgi:nucleoid DNA-binding protein
LLNYSSSCRRLLVAFVSTSNCSRRSDSNEQKNRPLFLDTLSSLAYKAIRKEGEFVLPGFGKLVKQKRKARIGINPKPAGEMSSKTRPG